MSKIAILSISTLVAFLSLSCDKKENDTVYDDSYTVTFTKTRYDNTYQFVVNNNSGSKIETSEGEFYFYEWKNCYREPSAYPYVYAEGYTEAMITTSIPSTMMIVNTRDEDIVPIELTKIDDKNYSMKYHQGGCGYGAGYIVITGENGVSKLITVGAMDKLEASVGPYPSILTYSIGKDTTSFTLSNRQEAEKNAVEVYLGTKISIDAIQHDYIPHYDVHNTVGSIEFQVPQKASISGNELPINLTEFTGVTVTPADTGYMYIPITCRKPDGTYGNDEKQYCVFKVKENKK